MCVSQLAAVVSVRIDRSTAATSVHAISTPPSGVQIKARRTFVGAVALVEELEGGDGEARDRGHGHLLVDLIESAY